MARPVGPPPPHRNQRRPGHVPRQPASGPDQRVLGQFRGLLISPQPRGKGRPADAKGLKTPATMLYGHIEEPRHRVDHVLRLRELQDETGGFQVFIPLRYQHDFVDSADGKIRNRLQERTTMASPTDSLKTFAVS